MRRDAPENPRKFYAGTDVEAMGGGFAVRLDRRGAKTPAGRPLVLPIRALADLVAAEWAAQGEHVVFASMPTTRLAWAAIDGVAAAPAETRAAVARYAESDLLCYPAGRPRVLAERQRDVWAPLLAWADESLGLRFEPAPGLLHHPQPVPTLASLRALLGEADTFTLTGLSAASSLFGSAILALALWRGRLDGPAAFAASRLDEAFQESQWGRDAEAAARQATLAAEAVALERWFRAL